MSTAPAPEPHFGGVLSKSEIKRRADDEALID